MKFDKNSNLDDLFSSVGAQNNGANPEDKEVKSKEIAKEDDIRTINREAAELSKAFERENKEMFEQMRREEKEEERRRKEAEKQEQENQIKEVLDEQEIEQEIPLEDVQEDEKSEPVVEKKEKKSLRVRLMSFMAIPFLIIGLVLIWNCFVEEIYIPSQLDPIIMVLAVAFYTFATICVVSAIRGKHTLGKIITLSLLGLLSLGCAVLVIIFKGEVTKFLLIGGGILGFLVAFLYQLKEFIIFAKTKKEERKFPAFKTVMCCIVAGAGVLLIIANFITGEVFTSVVGIITALAGTLMFAA